MASTIALIKTNYGKHRFKKQKVSHFVFLNRFIAKHFKIKNSIRVLLSILIICATAFYLFQINRLSIQGFKIKEYKKNLKILEEANTDLKLKITQLQSLDNLKEISTSLKMVKINQADYISPTSSAVAIK